MNFDIGKCIGLHISSKTGKTNYSINSIELHKVNEEKKTGVITSHDFKYAVCGSSNKKKNFMSRVFKLSAKKLILTLYNSFVCSHHEQ